MIKFQRKKMNKKGWMKVLEAVIAITLIIGVLVYIMATTITEKDMSGVVGEKERYILDAISKDDSLRNDIVSEKYDNVNLTIKGMISTNWEFDTKICELDNICSSINTPVDKDVYVSEVVVVSNKTSYIPKKLRLFIWMK